MTAHHFCHIIFLQSESPDLYSKGWANSRAQLPGVGDYWSCFRAACHSFHLLIYTTAITILSSCRFIYSFIWLHQVFVAALRIFTVACGIFRCTSRAPLLVMCRLQSSWAQQLWRVGLVAPWHGAFQFLEQGSVRGIKPVSLHWKVDS